MSIRAILTDIEGTTTDLAFVKDVLFPYAQEALPDYVRNNADDPTVETLLDAARSEMGQPDADLGAVVDQFLQWIAEDRKITPLKQLQGLIWADGYRAGAFRGHVYEDAYRKLCDWRAQGKRLFVFSSGSVKAQYLLFAHTDWGDLNHLFEGNFDTVTGPKKDAASYRHIAAKINLPAEQILFLSDVAEELDAARSAGMHTVQLLRDGGEPGSHPHVESFDQIHLEVFQ